MVAQNLKPAIRAAIRFHEIGDETPYRISFAGKGNSGGSFGFMQGDLAAGQNFVTKTLRDVLQAASVPSAKIASLMDILSEPHKQNPLNAADTHLIDAALAANKPLVDLMDERILEEVYTDTDKCMASANMGHRQIQPRALLYFPLWVNMTGEPTKILDWLEGENVGGGIPVAPATIDTPAIEGYLLKQKYYVENPGNFPHMRESVAKGVPLLP